MAKDGPASELIVTIESRALKRGIGPLAWAVLEDVSLDAVLHDGRWLAATSTRRLAHHLGLTPGTVARALARLCTDGLVHREDRRDTRTGRFGESVYVVAPMAALLPRGDSPHTAQPATVSPRTAPPSEAPPCEDDERTEPGRRLGSSGRRRAGGPDQQLLLGDESATAPVPLHPSTTTTTTARQPNHETPESQNLDPIAQRATDTCQPSGRAVPGRAPC